MREKLYVAGDSDGGFWACEQPDGTLVGVRHVIDFISVATTLSEDLSDLQRRQMVAFVKRELLTRHWMRALSRNDTSLLHPSTNSDRKDHGPFGAYDGWLGETVEAFCAMGDYAGALALVRAMAAVYDDGPGGQSHQVFELEDRVLRPPLKAAADQQWSHPYTHTQSEDYDWLTLTPKHQHSLTLSHTPSHSPLKGMN